MHGNGKLDSFAISFAFQGFYWLDRRVYGSPASLRVFGLHNFESRQMHERGQLETGERSHGFGVHVLRLNSSRALPEEVGYCSMALNAAAQAPIQALQLADIVIHRNFNLARGVAKNSWRRSSFSYNRIHFLCLVTAIVVLMAAFTWRTFTLDSGS
jgi:hypothetical protein